MDQTLNSFLKFNKNAVIGDDGNDLTNRFFTDRIAVCHRRPWIFPELLDTKRYAVIVLIILQNLNLELLADFIEFCRM